MCFSLTALGCIHIQCFGCTAWAYSYHLNECPALLLYKHSNKILTNGNFQISPLPSLVCAHHLMYIMYLFSGLLEDLCSFVLNQKSNLYNGQICPPQSFVFVVAVL